MTHRRPILLNLLFALIVCAISTLASAEEWQETLKLPFGVNPQEPRASFDIVKNFDLSATDEVRITFSVDNPEAVRSVSLYFHSGGGWYAIRGDVKKSGRQTLVFPLSERGDEGSPAGLDKIDQLRLSFWRGQNVDAVVELHGWELYAYPMVMLNPMDTRSETTARTIARRFRSLVASYGIEVGMIEQSDLTATALQNRRIVILPINPELTTEQIALLKQFVESGGKLLAFYLLPPELMRTLGFTTSTYIRSPEGAEAFAKVRFDSGFASEFGKGTPDSFEQRSSNIHSAKPLSSPNNNAKVAGTWLDASGQTTDHAALLVSDRGAFFSHILLEGDTDNKQGVVLALLAKWHPELWTDLMTKRLENLYAIGEVSSETETEKAARIASIALKVKLYETAGDARQFCMEFPALRKELSEQYVRSLPSVPGELRLWWEHAGTGSYPGDWDRTMKELKENGFNAVIPNMLWGGLAHYDSKLLPRSRTFDQYGDQIEQAVRAGKKHGVEVHVWKVNFNCSNAPREFVNSMRQAGRTQVKFDGTPGNWLCPSHPENRKLEWESMVEVARNYEVDGIHFDYIRYPDSEHCYCEGCKERFEKHVGETLDNFPQVTRTDKWRSRFDDWRCAQITALVADVHREAKKVKPSIKISAAVFPSYPDCRRWVLQDWPVWVDKGYLDFLCPMNYSASVTTFDAYTSNQMKIVAGRIPVYPGIGATATGIALTPDQVAAQIMIARNHGAPGFTIFNLNRETIGRIPPVLRLGPTKP